MTNFLTALIIFAIGGALGSVGRVVMNLLHIH